MFRFDTSAKFFTDTTPDAFAYADTSLLCSMLRSKDKKQRAVRSLPVGMNQRLAALWDTHDALNLCPSRIRPYVHRSVFADLPAGQSEAKVAFAIVVEVNVLRTVGVHQQFPDCVLPCIEKNVDTEVTIIEKVLCTP